MRIEIDSKLWVRLFKSALFIGVCIYVSIELLDRMPAGSLASLHLEWSFLVFGGLCALLSLALFAVVYREAQLFVQHEAEWLPAVLAAWISPLGKYLPGKIGSLLGAIWIYGKFGVGASVSTGVLVLSTASVLSACFFLLVPYAATRGSLSAPFGLAEALPWIALVAGLVFAVPRLFLLPINFLLRWMDRNPLSVDLRYSRYLLLIMLGAVQLALAGTAFWLTANAVTDVGWIDWYRMTAAYTVAGVIGMFAVFAPGGLGVREGLLLLLLGSVIEGPQLALTVVLTRVALILCEVSLALVGMVLWKTMRSGTSNSA